MKSGMRPLIVVKIGTNVLTLPSGRVNINLILDIVDQIAVLRDRYRFLLVSSGAVGTGRGLVNLDYIKDARLRKQMHAAVGQGKIYSVYANALAEKGIVSAQALLTKRDFKIPEHFNSIMNTLKSLIESEILPIINENDVVSATESTFGDNDLLGAITAGILQADKLIILSDIQGLFTSDPKTDKSASLVRTIDRISEETMKLCRNTLSGGGTGGMYSKLTAVKTVMEAGIEAVIAYGREERILEKILTGQFDGTTFLPAKLKKNISHRIWIKNMAETKGEVLIDAGAEQALLNNKSLLAVGIIKVSGVVKKGDTVVIKNSSGQRIGVGISGMDTKQYEDAQGLPGGLKGKIFIHKNHLYLL